MNDATTTESDHLAHEQADAACRGPHWPRSARPTQQEIEFSLADAVVTAMVPPDELQRRHERGNHDACPPYWCDMVTPPGQEKGE